MLKPKGVRRLITSQSSQAAVKICFLAENEVPVNIYGSLHCFTDSTTQLFVILKSLAL